VLVALVGIALLYDMDRG